MEGALPVLSRKASRVMVAGGPIQRAYASGEAKEL
jgi:hypothetical protein